MRPWLLWTFLAVLCWGIWALLSKLVGDALSPAHSQAISTLGILPVLFFLAWQTWTQKVPGAQPHRLRGAVTAATAGLLTCLGNIAYYQLLNTTKAATAVPLTAVYPVVTVILALIVLKERLNVWQCAGIGLSLLAIYLFNVPTEQGLASSGVLFALAPIALWGVAALFQKIATNNISGEAATCWFLAAFLPVGVAILLREPLAHLPTSRVWLLVVSLGFTFALGNAALLFAFARDGKASVIAPLAGLYPVVSIPVAIVLLGERIGLRESFAIVSALAGVAAVSLPQTETPAAKMPQLTS